MDLYQNMNMTPKFSGHDTFPLRYGWLHKAVNLLSYKGNSEKSTDEIVRDAIVTLGVGRNMVNAIRYWAEMADVLQSSPDSSSRSALSVSPLGDFLFNEDAKNGNADPYLEKKASIWLLHYRINANNSVLTSYRYFFNYCNFQSFEKTKLIDEIMTNTIALTGMEAGKKTTVKKDVDCFLHTYIKKGQSKTIINEDHFSSPLSELGLITESSSGYFVSELGERKTLPAEIFAYALCDFIKKENIDSGVNTMDFDSLLSKPGSPGRVFRLSEQGLSHKLDEASLLEEGLISWQDSLGLRQILVNEKVKQQPELFLEMYYGNEYAY